MINMQDMTITSKYKIIKMDHTSKSFNYHNTLINLQTKEATFALFVGVLKHVGWGKKEI